MSHHETRDGRFSTPQEDRLFIQIFAVFALFFGVAVFHAFARTDARPAQCADYRAGEMAACLEGVAR